MKAERAWFLGEGEEPLAKERAHGSFTRQALLVAPRAADLLEAARRRLP